MKCPKCQGDVIEIRGSYYCSSCGEAINLDEVKEELEEKIEQAKEKVKEEKFDTALPEAGLIDKSEISENTLGEYDTSGVTSRETIIPDGMTPESSEEDSPEITPGGQSSDIKASQKLTDIQREDNAPAEASVSEGWDQEDSPKEESSQEEQGQEEPISNEDGQDVPSPQAENQTAVSTPVDNILRSEPEAEEEGTTVSEEVSKIQRDAVSPEADKGQEIPPAPIAQENIPNKENNLEKALRLKILLIVVIVLNLLIIGGIIYFLVIK